jgi:hypothetical protein
MLMLVCMTLDTSEKCWTTCMNVITANGDPSMLTQNYAPPYASNWAGVHPVVSRLRSRASLRPSSSLEGRAEAETTRHIEDRQVSEGA